MTVGGADLALASRSVPAASIPPLHGLRVVALEQYIAGPLCTQVLADAGAEVIKVERPEGDPRRHYPPMTTADGRQLSGGFAPFNRGKKSVVLDLATDEGRDDLARLLDSAALLVTNLRPGVLDRLGLTPDVVATRHPELVHVEISGFGRSGGPFAGRPAFDAVVQAMGGLAWASADADGVPRLAAAGSADVLAGMHAAFGALAALTSRSLGRRTQHVDVSMYEVVVSFLQRQVAVEAFGGAVPPGPDPYTPAGVFRAGDGGWLALLVTTDRLWQGLCSALGAEDWLHDDRLAVAPGRGAAMADEILPRLTAWAATRTTEAVVQQLTAAGVPAGVVQTVADVRSCPHLAARGLFDLVQHEGGVAGPSVAGAALRYDGNRPHVMRVPSLGEHTTEVLASLRT